MTSRALKRSTSFVLALLRGSPYRAEYDSPLHSLRPRRTSLLNVLQEVQQMLTAIALANEF
jgi:hypothetical protein